MTIENRSAACLDAEVLAAFADGKLTRSEMPAVLAHLRDCPNCMSALEIANEIAGAKEAHSFRLWWAAAAAVIAIAIVVAIPLLRRDESPTAKLSRYAPADARTVETRLAAFPWAPYRGPLRAGDAAEDARRLQLAGVAGDAVARANTDPAAEAQRTAGVALLLVGEPENALKRLRLAAERAPNDAATWSDLAAALDAAAVRLERKSLHTEALAAADHALAVDASHPAALFNRALILEHLGLGGEARKAWDRYLAVDPSSHWADEARQHLRRLPVSTGEARFRAAQTDLATVATMVPSFPQLSRAYAEGIYLGRWGASGDVANLDAARAIGDALVRSSGESLLRDSVRVIDASAGERRKQLAAAHALYDRARATLWHRQSQSAERELRDAAADFERVGSPMSLVARYYAACARFENDDIAGSRAELERLLAESNAHPEFVALQAQIHWQLATVAFSAADWVSALEPLSEAEQRFRRLGERANLAFIKGMQSTALGCLGRPDEAWAARIEAFRGLDWEGYADRLPVTLGGAARMELHAGRLDTAQSFLHLEVNALRNLQDHAQLTNALVRETLLQIERGDRVAASEAERQAMIAARSLSGPARGIAFADTSLAAGAVALPDNARAAREALTSAIDFYRASGRMIFLPQAHLLRARASLRVADRAAALRDLDEGLEVLDRHGRRLAGPLVGTDILDAGAALGQEAIRLRLDMGDVAGAFREGERRNLRVDGSADSPVLLDVLQHRLAGSSSAVMMLMVVPGEAMAITVTATTIATARAPLDEQALDARIRGAVEGKNDDAAGLYDALVRPSEPVLAGIERLIVVADPRLRNVPYAALYDRMKKRYLIEAVAVAVAQSASSLREQHAAAPRLAVAVALPSGTLAPLPGARRELDDLTSLYPKLVVIEPAFATLPAFAAAAAHAGVVHIAGHTSHVPGMSEPALPFAQHSATWRDLCGLRFEAASVVILSACETLSRTSTGSLGSGVLAAGAGDVIGTLAPIADDDAAGLFQQIHRGLAAGMPASDALRRAQLDALAMESATDRHTTWRAVALLTRHI
ncbi:MAG TPA: CHAT domain-containing protein [Thermoanaerobaculia bacterium]|jgi:CHAT domain-containing protein|nr:CHAT domain-containing protein [Thermoanaerobaculia bacterium]